jgi:hypothetical protein
LQLNMYTVEMQTSSPLFVSSIVLIVSDFPPTGLQKFRHEANNGSSNPALGLGAGVHKFKKNDGSHLKIPGARRVILSTILRLYAHSGVVVKALRYKPAGRGFDSRWYHWNFFVT